jgi:hypothetical protein
MYAFVPEKPPSLVGRNFCLAISRVFTKASKLMLSQENKKSEWLSKKRHMQGAQLSRKQAYSGTPQ